MPIAYSILIFFNYNVKDLFYLKYPNYNIFLIIYESLKKLLINFYFICPLKKISKV